MEIYLLRSWKRLSNSSNPRYLKARVIKHIQFSLSTGSKQLDNCITCNSNDFRSSIADQLAVKFFDRASMLIDPRQYTIEQRWSEELQLFEVNVKILYFGKNILNRRFSHRNFIGLDDEEVAVFATDIEDNDELLYEAEDINNNREVVVFTLARSRIEINDCKGKIYLRYGYYDTNILHLTTEPTPLHQIFWNWRRTITQPQTVINPIMVASTFSSLCQGLFDSLAKIIRQREEGNYECGTEEELLLFDIEHIKMITHQLNICRELLIVNPAAVRPVDNEHLNNYMDLVVRKLEFLQILDLMDKSVQRNDLKEFIRLAKTVTRKDLGELGQLSSTRLEYDPNNSIFSIDKERVIKLLTDENILSDYDQFSKHADEEKESSNNFLPNHFWRRLRCHNIYSATLSVINKIFESETPLKNSPYMRIYPLLRNRHFDLDEEDKKISFLVKEALFNNRKYDFKLENSLIYVRESRVGVIPTSNWRQASLVCPNIFPKQYMKFIPENPYLVMVHSVDNSYRQHLSVLIPDGLNHSSENQRPVGIWYSIETLFKFIEYVGKTADDDNWLVVVTEEAATTEKYLSFLRRDDDIKKFKEYYMVSVKQLLPNRKEHEIVANDRYKITKSNLFFIRDNLILGINQPQVLESSSKIYRDFYLYRLTINTRQAHSEAVKTLAVQLDLLHRHLREDKLELGKGSIYDQDKAQECKFFRYSPNTYLYLSCSKINKEIQVFACVLSPTVKIFEVVGLTKSLTSRLMRGWELSALMISAAWDPNKRILAATKVDSQLSKPSSLFYFKLE